MLLLKLAIRPWRLSPLQQGVTALASSVLLFLGGVFAWSGNAVREASVQIRGRHVLTAYLSPSVPRGRETALIDEIRVQVGAANVRFRDSDQFLEELRKAYPELSGELSALSVDSPSVIPRYVSIEVNEGDEGVDHLVAKLKSVKGLASVDSSTHRYRPVFGALSALQWMFWALSIGVFVAVVAVISHWARLNESHHQPVFLLLKRMGVAPALSLLPPLLQGLAFGLLSGGAAYIALILATHWVSTHLMALSPLFALMGESDGIAAFAWVPPLSAGLGALAGVVYPYLSRRAGANSGIYSGAA